MSRSLYGLEFAKVDLILPFSDRAMIVNTAGSGALYRIVPNIARSKVVSERLSELTA